MAKEAKRRDVEKVLKMNQWQLLRSKGGHDVWRSPNQTTTLAIPRHNKISAGVIRQLIKTLPQTPPSWQ